MSRRLEFFYDVLLEFDSPVINHSFVLRTIPHSFAGQWVENVKLELNPPASYDIQYDSFGNVLQVGYLSEPHSHFHYKVSGTVLRDMSSDKMTESIEKSISNETFSVKNHNQCVADQCVAEENSDAVGDFSPVWRLPTRFTAFSSEIQKFFDALTLPEEKKELAWYLCESVHKNMHYTPGMTGVSTTAAEAFLAGGGVCQDFAHLYLALAREVGLSARYCNGITEGEGASHAWCEVLLDGKWTGIDPTRNKWTDEGYIRFNIGRDFSDCPMERGILKGCGNQKQIVCMKVWQIEGD